MVLTSGFLVWLTVAAVGQRFAPQINRSKEKWKNGFLWASFGGAVLAGAAMVDNTIGEWATGVSGFHPLVAWPPVIYMVAVLLKDVFADAVPNVKACICAVLLPAWSIGLGGSFGQGLGNIFTFLNTIQGDLNANLFG